MSATPTTGGWRIVCRRLGNLNSPLLSSREAAVCFFSRRHEDSHGSYLHLSVCLSRATVHQLQAANRGASFEGAPAFHWLPFRAAVPPPCIRTRFLTLLLFFISRVWRRACLAPVWLAGFFGGVLLDFPVRPSSLARFAPCDPRPRACLITTTNNAPPLHAPQPHHHQFTSSPLQLAFVCCCPLSYTSWLTNHALAPPSPRHNQLPQLAGPCLREI